MPETDGRQIELKILNLAVKRGILTAEQLSTITDDPTDGACDRAIQENMISSAQVDLLRPLSEPSAFLPDYEFLDIIGEGATGTVYKACQTKLNRLVALKLLKLSALENHTATARSQIEAQIGASLRHPNIVAVHDYGVQYGRVYLAMEFVEGESLLQFIERQGRVDQSLALQLTKQVISALAHAADNAVVHRDVKPANLILTQDLPGLSLPEGIPAVKVSDFGLAFQQQNENATRLTADGATLGTPCYVAPEQLTSTNVDHRADIYALGASLYHMITGVQPFGNANAFQALAAKMQGNEDWRNDIPEDVGRNLRQLILNMTAHDVNDRIQDYKTLASRVDELLKNQDGDTPAPVLKTAARQWLPTGKTRVLAAAAIIVGITAFAVSNSFRGAIAPSLIEVPVELTNNKQFLFDGTSVPRGRQTNLWNPFKDSESGNVLAGANGTLRLALPDFASENSDFYRFRVGVNPLEKAAGDICFAVQPTGDCHIVRLNNGIARIGQGTLKGNDFELLNDSNSIEAPQSSDQPRYHSVHLNHQPGGWFIYINGQRLGAVPTSTTDESQITIRAINGTVHFDAIEVDETAETTPDNTANSSL